MKKLTYLAAHKRIATAHGLATSHTCPCGQPAAEWAYQHSAAQEFIDERGRRYSTDLADYVAMCHDCHRLLDSLPHPDRQPVLVTASDPDPEYWAERNAAGVLKGTATRRERLETDPEYAEAVAEDRRVNGLALQERHLEKLEADPEYAAKSRAASVANLAIANQTLAARRAADPDFDAKMRSVYQSVGRRMGELQAQMRRKCDQCPMVSSPAGVARHQKATGHEGWTSAREDG